MSVLISGSMAYDTVLSYEGRFAENLHAEALDRLNLTFPAARMRRDFGGCAGNIAYALRLLGGSPLPWGCLGADAAPYLERFRALGIPADGIRTLPDDLTAQCFITTDADGNQLASFYGGAMDRSEEAPWPSHPTDPPTLAILSPGGRTAMPVHAQLCRAHGVPYIFDPGQAAPLFRKAALLDMIQGALALAFSDYEEEIIRLATGCSPADFARAGKIVFHTHGAAGSSVWLPHQAALVEVEALALPPDAEADPVGAGDAYRGGILYALSRGLDAVAGARLGAVLGAAKAACRGAQAYSLTLDEARRRYQAQWGGAPF